MSSSHSNRASLWFLAITLLSFLAASTAPTPLYHLYQEQLQFSAAILTLVFAVYALSLLVALLTVGSLSDHLGRKPVIFTAVLLNIVAMLLFIQADSVGWLISARVLQGFATGMATAVPFFTSAVSSTAWGATTVMATAATSLSTPSLAEYWKVSAPE